MASIREIVDVPEPLDVVFDYLAAFERIAEWDPTVRSAQASSAGPGGAGSRYEVEVAFGGRTVPMHYEIVHHDRPHRLILHGLSATNLAVDDIRLSSTDVGTRIEWDLTVSLRGPLRFGTRLIAPLMMPALRSLGRQAMDGLARSLGGQRVTE